MHITLVDCVITVSLSIEIETHTATKYTTFPDYWLCTSAVIQVYLARAGRKGYMVFILVYIL